MSLPGWSARFRRKNSTISPCTAIRGGPTVLQLNLLSGEKWRKLAFPDDSFGFALPAAGGRFPYYANIAAHRLGALADSSSADPAAILGCILAHEIGHLLLGVGSHSGKGIMTANWSGETLLLADQRRLRFTPKQGRRIRRNVDQRCIADSSRTSPRGKSDRTKKRYRPFL